MILIDAGPLVALATPEDRYHRQCVDALNELPLPYVTTWCVLAEAAWLVIRPVEFVQSITNSCSSGSLEIRHLDSDALPWITTFLRRYQSIRAQLADASLMYIAEQEKIETIFTLDRRDFSVYRTSRKGSLKVVP